MILDNQTNQEENTQQQQPQQPQQQPALTREIVLSRFTNSDELVAAVSELNPNDFAERYSPENPLIGHAIWYDVNKELERQSVISSGRPVTTETTRKPEYAQLLPSWVPFIGGEFTPEAVGNSLVKETIGDVFVRADESLEKAAINLVNLFSSDDDPILNMRGLTKEQTKKYLKTREDYIAKAETMPAYSKLDRDKTAKILEKQQKIEELQNILALSNDPEERKRAEASLRVNALTPEEEAYTQTKAFNDIKDFVGMRNQLEQFNKASTMDREFWGLNNPKMANVDDPENLPDVLRKIRGMVADTSGLLISSAALPGTAIAGGLTKVLGFGKTARAIYAGSNPLVNTGFRLLRPSTWPAAAMIAAPRVFNGNFIKLAIGGAIKHVGGATLSTLPQILEEAKENEITTIGQRFENGVPAGLEVEDKRGMLAAAWINDVGTVMFPKLPFVPRWFKSTGLESASNKILQSVEKNWPKISSKALQETFGKGTSLTKAIQAQVAAESMAVLGKYGKGIASSEIDALTKFIGTLTQDSIALGLTTFAQQAIKDLSARGYLKADQFVENWLDYFSGGDYTKNVKEAMYAGLMSVALAGRSASAEFLNDTKSAFKFPNLRRKQAYLNSEMWNSAETVEYDKIAEKLNGNRISSSDYNKNYSDILNKVMNHDIDGLVQTTGYSQKYIEDIINLSTPSDVASELTDSLGISDKRAKALKDYQDTLADTQYKKEVDGQFSKTPIRINKIYSGRTHHGVEDLIKDLKATRDLVDNKTAFAELLTNHRNSALDPSNQEYNKRISEILKENPSDRALHLANSIMRRVGNSIYDVHTFDNKLRKFIDSSFVKNKTKSIENPRPLHDLYDADLRDKDNNDLWVTAGSRPLTQEELNTIDNKIQAIQEEIDKLNNTEKSKATEAALEDKIHKLKAQKDAYEFLRNACAKVAERATRNGATDISSVEAQKDFKSTLLQKFFGNAEDGGYYIGTFSYVPKITQKILEGNSADVVRYLDKLNTFLNSQKPEVKVQKNRMNKEVATKEYAWMRAILSESFGKNCSELEQLLNATFDKDDDKNVKIFDSLENLQKILKDAKPLDEVIPPQNNASSEAKSSGNTNTQPSPSEANTSDSRATTEAPSNARDIDATLNQQSAPAPAPTSNAVDKYGIPIPEGYKAINSNIGSSPKFPYTPIAIKPEPFEPKSNPDLKGNINRMAENGKAFFEKNLDLMEQDLKLGTYKFSYCDFITYDGNRFTVNTPLLAKALLESTMMPNKGEFDGKEAYYINVLLPGFWSKRVKGKQGYFDLPVIPRTRVYKYNKDDLNKLIRWNKYVIKSYLGYKANGAYTLGKDGKYANLTYLQRFVPYLARLHTLDSENVPSLFSVFKDLQQRTEGSFKLSTDKSTIKIGNKNYRNLGTYYTTKNLNDELADIYNTPGNPAVYTKYSLRALEYKNSAFNLMYDALNSFVKKSDKRNTTINDFVSSKLTNPNLKNLQDLLSKAINKLQSNPNKKQEIVQDWLNSPIKNLFNIFNEKNTAWRQTIIPDLVLADLKSPFGAPLQGAVAVDLLMHGYVPTTEIGFSTSGYDDGTLWEYDREKAQEYIDQINSIKDHPLRVIFGEPVKNNLQMVDNSTIPVTVDPVTKKLQASTESIIESSVQEETVDTPSENTAEQLTSDLSTETEEEPVDDSLVDDPQEEAGVQIQVPAQEDSNQQVEEVKAEDVQPQEAVEIDTPEAINPAEQLSEESKEMLEEQDETDLLEENSQENTDESHLEDASSDLEDSTVSNTESAIIMHNSLEALHSIFKKLKTPETTVTGSVLFEEVLADTPKDEFKEEWGIKDFVKLRRLYSKLNKEHKEQFKDNLGDMLLKFFKTKKELRDSVEDYFAEDVRDNAEVSKALQEVVLIGHLNKFVEKFNQKLNNDKNISFNAAPALSLDSQSTLADFVYRLSDSLAKKAKWDPIQAQMYVLTSLRENEIFSSIIPEKIYQNTIRNTIEGLREYNIHKPSTIKVEATDDFKADFAKAKESLQKLLENEDLKESLDSSLFTALTSYIFNELVNSSGGLSKALLMQLSGLDSTKETSEYLNAILQNTELKLEDLKGSIAVESSFVRSLGKYLFSKALLRQYLPENLNKKQIELIQIMIGVRFKNILNKNDFIRLVEPKNSSTKLIKLVEDPKNPKKIDEIKQLKKLDSKNSFSNYVLGALFEEKHVIFDGNVKVPRRNNDNMVVPKEMRRALRKYMEPGYVIDPEIETFYKQYLDKKVDGDLTVRDYLLQFIYEPETVNYSLLEDNEDLKVLGNLLGLDNPNKYIESLGVGIRARNNANIQALINIAEARDNWEVAKADLDSTKNSYIQDHLNTFKTDKLTHVWFPVNPGNNYRCFQNGKEFNPNAQKTFTRYLMYRPQTIGKEKLDHTNKLILSYHLLQNFDKKPEKKLDIGEYIEKANDIIQALNKDDLLVNLAKKDLKDLTTEDWDKIHENMKEAKLEVEIPVQILNILRTLKQLVKDGKLLDFKSDLSDIEISNFIIAETDGITNGAAIGLITFLGLASADSKEPISSKDWENLEKIGIFKIDFANGKPITKGSLYDAIKDKSTDEYGRNKYRDMYETVIDNYTQYGLKNTQGRVCVSIEAGRSIDAVGSLLNFLSIKLGTSDLDKILTTLQAKNNNKDDPLNLDSIFLERLEKDIKVYKTGKTPTEATKVPLNTFKKNYENVMKNFLERNDTKYPFMTFNYGASATAEARDLLQNRLGDETLKNLNSELQNVKSIDEAREICENFFMHIVQRCIPVEKKYDKNGQKIKDKIEKNMEQLQKALDNDFAKMGDNFDITKISAYTVSIFYRAIDEYFINSVGTSLYNAMYKLFPHIKDSTAKASAGIETLVSVYKSIEEEATKQFLEKRKISKLSEANKEDLKAFNKFLDTFRLAYKTPLGGAIPLFDVLGKQDASKGGVAYGKTYASPNSESYVGRGAAYTVGMIQSHDSSIATLVKLYTPFFLDVYDAAVTSGFIGPEVARQQDLGFNEICIDSGKNMLEACRDLYEFFFNKENYKNSDLGIDLQGMFNDFFAKAFIINAFGATTLDKGNFTSPDVPMSGFTKLIKPEVLEKLNLYKTLDEKIDILKKEDDFDAILKAFTAKSAKNQKHYVKSTKMTAQARVVKVLLKSLLNIDEYQEGSHTQLATLDENGDLQYNNPDFIKEAKHILATNGFNDSLCATCLTLSLRVAEGNSDFKGFEEPLNTLNNQYDSAKSLSKFEDDYFLKPKGEFNLKKTLESILKAIEKKVNSKGREFPVGDLIEYLKDTPKDLKVRNIGPLAAVNAMLDHHSRAMEVFNKTPFVISQYNTGKLSTVVHYAPGKGSEKSVNFGPKLERISKALSYTSKDLETFFREPNDDNFKETFKKYLQIFKEALSSNDYSELTPEIIHALVTHINPKKINAELIKKGKEASEIYKEGELAAQAKIKEIEEIKDKLEKQSKSKSKKIEKIPGLKWYNNIIEKGITKPTYFTKEQSDFLTEYGKFKKAFENIARAFVTLQDELTQLDLELATDDFNYGKAFTYKSTETADNFSNEILTDLNDIQTQNLKYPNGFNEELKAELTDTLGRSRLHTILATIIRKAPIQVFRLQQEFQKKNPSEEATIGNPIFIGYVAKEVIKPEQIDAAEGEADSLVAGSQINYRSDNSKDIKSLELTEENVLEVFDNLPTNSNVAGTTLCSDEHRAYLRDLMQTTMQGLKAVDMIVGETTDTNYGTAEIKNGKRKISIYKSIGNAIQKSGLPYSMQELMAHESTHLVWWTLDNTDPLFQELRRIFSVFKQEYFGKPELFMIHQYDNTDPRYAIELEAAKKRMNYIFREAEDPIREFATFGLTNETMRGLLQRTADTLEVKKTGFKGFLQTLGDIFTRYVDKLFSKASNGKYSRTANLLSNLELVHNIAVERMSNHREVGLLAKTATVVDSALEAADVKLKTVTSKLSKVPYVASLTSNGFGNYLKSGRFTSEIMAELGIDGSSSYLKRGILRATINHVANINKKRQQQIAVDSDAIRRAFHSQLDDTADLAITNGILRTDLQTLYDENDKVNSVNYIRRILTDSNFHAQELARVKNILAKTTVNHGPALGHINVGAFLINSCNSLANYMINETHLYDFCNHSNANQIGRLWGYSRLTQEFDLNDGLNERIANCNTYITLKALDLLNPNQKQILTNIANSEFITDSKNNGITYLVRYQETAIKNGYKDLGNDAAIKSLHKGYVQDKTNPYHRVLKVYNNSDFMELQKKGYVEYTNPNAVTDPKAPYKKYMHSTIPVANGYVSGAVATINSKARGESIYNPDTLPANMSLMTYRKRSATIFKQQHMPDQKRFEQTIDYAYNNPNPTLHTILNKDGSISDLQESLPAEIKDTVLNRSSNFAELAARTNAAYSELEDSSKHNEALLKVLIQDAKDTEEERNQHPELFIAVGPEQTGLGLEAYALLPTNARTFLWREYFDENNNVLYVRKSVFSQIFGFSEKSLGQLADNDHVYNKLDLPLKFLNSFIHRLLGNKFGVSFEFIWRFLQSTGKDTIVVKNFITTFNNIRSNIILLKNQGCSLHDIIRSHIEGYKHISAYRQDLAKMAKIRNSIRYEDLTPDELSTKTKEYNSIKANLIANPMYDILRRGALTTLESDEAQVDYEILGNKFGDALTEMHKNILKSDNLGAKVLRNALMLHGSAFYQLAKDFASGSDTIAKWVMYKNDPRSKGTPEQRDAAFLDAAELFINYDIPTNEWVHLANQVGVLNFSKFMLRIGRPLLRQFRDKPARVMAYLIIRGILKALGYNGLSNIDAYGAAAWSVDAWTRKISQGVTGGAVGSSMVTELPVVNTLS